MFLVALIFLLFTSTTVTSLECYQCDSTEDKECATKPGQQIEVEECLKADDECATVIVAGHTRRGCLSRLFPNNYCPEPCERCKTNLCNRNIFPADRLRCYQCLGASCVNVANKDELILPCPIYNEKDRCYTNIIIESNVQRGCEKTDLPATCPNICLKCNYDGCNSEPGIVEEHCLECSHTFPNPNPYCMRSVTPVMAGKKCNIEENNLIPQSVKICTNKMLYGHKGKCFTYINEQTGFAQRGCSTTKPFFPTGTVTECYGKNCNNECFSIGCSTCNATSIYENLQCRSGLSLKVEQCTKDTFACYACESPKTLRRGCANSTYIPAINEACYHCSDSDGCNSKKNVRTCFHCSSRDDANCASVTGNPDRIEKKLCDSVTELCASTVVSKYNMVYVVRGCESNVPDCSEFDPYCVRCNGSLCNNVPIQWNTKSTQNIFNLYTLEASKNSKVKVTKNNFKLLG